MELSTLVDEACCMKESGDSTFPTEFNDIHLDLYNKIKFNEVIKKPDDLSNIDDLSCETEESKLEEKNPPITRGQLKCNNNTYKYTKNWADSIGIRESFDFEDDKYKKNFQHLMLLLID